MCGKSFDYRLANCVCTMVQINASLCRWRPLSDRNSVIYAGSHGGRGGTGGGTVTGV